ERSGRSDRGLPRVRGEEPRREARSFERAEHGRDERRFAAAGPAEEDRPRPRSHRDGCSLEGAGDLLGGDVQGFFQRSLPSASRSFASGLPSLSAPMYARTLSFGSLITKSGTVPFSMNAPRRVLPLPSWMMRPVSPC